MSETVHIFSRVNFESRSSSQSSSIYIDNEPRSLRTTKEFIARDRVAVIGGKRASTSIDCKHYILESRAATFSKYCISKFFKYKAGVLTNTLYALYAIYIHKSIIIYRYKDIALSIYVITHERA